jgi:hypothetical protein
MKSHFKYLRVIQMTIFKNSKEDIEGIRVRFLNLIYKNQSEGFLMDCLSESSAITITHITWWGTNELYSHYASPCTHSHVQLYHSLLLPFHTNFSEPERYSKLLFSKITYIILFPQQQIMSYLKQDLCIIVKTANKRKYWNLTQK